MYVVRRLRPEIMLCYVMLGVRRCVSDLSRWGGYTVDVMCLCYRATRNSVWEGTAHAVPCTSQNLGVLSTDGMLSTDRYRYVLAAVPCVMVSGS